MGRTSFIACIGAGLLGLGTLTLAPGCNVITPVAYAIHGPEKVEAVFTPDEDRTTVIFVDDPSGQLAQRRLRHAIADDASRRLMAKKIITDMIDSRPILNATTKERYGERKSISELGAEAGAEVVIYAVVTNFSLTPEDGTFVPVASLRVKVIDTETAQRVWPAAESGYLMEVRIQKRTSLTDADDGRLAVENELAGRAALGLAQLFYKHELPDSVLNGR